MAKEKPTSDPRQLWTFFGLLALVAAFFGYAVLPYMDPGAAGVVGKPAPDFTLSVISDDGEGNRIRLSDYREQVVLLDFWASWCGPCRAQAPIIDRVSQKLAGKSVSVIGVNTGDHVEAAQAFLTDAHLSYPSVLDTTGEVARAFGANQLPTLVLIDREGNVLSVQARIISEQELVALVEDALEAS